MSNSLKYHQWRGIKYRMQNSTRTVFNFQFFSVFSRKSYYNIILLSYAYQTKELLNKSHLRVFQTITLPLLRAFEIRLVQDQLVQGKIGKIRLGQFSFIQDFKRSKTLGDSHSSEPQVISLENNNSKKRNYLILNNLKAIR